jgi:hypothetical protein
VWDLNKFEKWHSSPNWHFTFPLCTKCWCGILCPLCAPFSLIKRQNKCLSHIKRHARLQKTGSVGWNSDDPLIFHPPLKQLILCTLCYNIMLVPWIYIKAMMQQHFSLFASWEIYFLFPIGRFMPYMYVYQCPLKNCVAVASFSPFSANCCGSYCTLGMLENQRVHTNSHTIKCCLLHIWYVGYTKTYKGERCVWWEKDEKWCEK